MTVTQGNISATLRAPPGRTISNFAIMREDNFKTVDFGNSTWTIYNATSGSTGTITFKAHFLHNVPIPGRKGWTQTVEWATWTRTLNGKIYKGVIAPQFVATHSDLNLCKKLDKNYNATGHCIHLKNIELSDNHMEFTDTHGDTIHLMRNG